MKLPRIRTVFLMSMALLASTLIFGLAFHQAFQRQQQSLETEDTKLEAKLNSLYHEVNKILEIRMHALELISAQVTQDIQSRPFNASNYYDLLGLYVTKFNMISSGMCNEKGEVLEVFHSDLSARKKFLTHNLFKHGFIEEINKRGSSVVMPMKRGQGAPLKLLIMASPIWDKNNKIVAYAGASISSIELQNLADKALKDSSEIKFLILDENKTAVASTIVSTGKEDPFRIIPSTLYRSSDQTTFTEGQTEDGVESRIASRGLKFRNTTLTLAVTESKDYLHREDKVIWRQTTILIALSIIVSFFASVILSNLITGPISNLIQGIKKIEEGTFNKDSLRDNPRFNEVLEARNALLSMERKLREHTEQLENEVKERTRELIETHKELDDQRARAMEASRLAALGEMAGGIAHEINNPLGVILASAERQLNRIRRKQVDLDQIEASFEKIESTSSRIAKIVQGLRTFSSSQGREPFEVVTVASILTATLSFCLEKFKHHNIDFRVSEFPEDLLLECSPTQISQVVLNLLNNAFDAIEKSHEKWIFVDVFDKQEYVEICVSDSGPGITETIQEKIFQPFFTTKDVGRGTGLGLSITKGIIENHKGKIFLKKNSPHTSFIVHLPKIL